MKSKFLESTDGHKSSRRLFAAMLIIVGISMSVIAYTIALFRPLGDSKIIIELITIHLGLGSGLSGLPINKILAIFNRKREKK